MPTLEVVIPEGEVVDTSSHIDIVTGALQQIFGNDMVCFGARLDMECTTFLFSVCSCSDLNQREKASSCWHIANELHDARGAARYTPRDAPSTDHKKGWEIKPGKIGGVLVAIVSAAWTEK